MNADFQDIIDLFIEAGVHFLVVGAHALAVHGVARSTGDIDLWVKPCPDNAARVSKALHKFGAPLAAHGVDTADFAKVGTIYQLGLPPRRIDILTSIDGVNFEQAWQGHLMHKVDGRDIPFLGRNEFLANKKAAGRPKDIADIALLAEKD